MLPATCGFSELLGEIDVESPGGGTAHMSSAINGGGTLKSNGGVINGPWNRGGGFVKSTGIGCSTGSIK